MLRRALISAALIGFMVLPVSGQGQPAPAGETPPPIKRTVLQKFDVPGAGYETIVGVAEIAPGVSIGRHTHVGIESGYLLEGAATLIVAGQSDKPLKPGDSYQIAPGAAHDARSGPNGAKVLATYVVEKGKPFATPAQ
jgi:quercetin dioxygenase-like cupin family protein